MTRLLLYWFGIIRCSLCCQPLDAFSYLGGSIRRHVKLRRDTFDSIYWHEKDWKRRRVSWSQREDRATTTWQRQGLFGTDREVPPPSPESQEPPSETWQSQEQANQQVVGLENTGEDYEWVAEDVEADLLALEYAINLDNAEQNLRQAERLEVLDAFAVQRRLLIPDMHLFVTRTLQWSVIFVILKRALLKRKSDQLSTLVGTWLMTLPWDIHFWFIVVLAPLVWLCAKRRAMVPQPIPQELQSFSKKYLHLSHYVAWEDPKVTCRDYVLCLTEQWASAVVGVACLGVFQLLCQGVLRIPASVPILGRITVVPVVSPPLMATVQFVTRLGAMVSVFQFPKLLFELQRQQQPRPVKFGVAMLQQMIGSMIQWGVPAGLASDLSQVLAGLPRRGLIAFYGSAIAFLSAMEVRFNASHKPSPSLPPSRLQILGTRTVGGIKSSMNFVPSVAATAIMLAMSHYVLVVGFTHRLPYLPRIPSLKAVANCAVLFAALGPMCHLAAIQRIFKIAHTHDMSLTTEPEAMQETLNNPQERAKRYQWRHQLQWREPVRIGRIVSNPLGNFLYWLFLSGSVEEQLYLEETKRIAEEVRHGVDSVNIWKKVKESMQNDPPGTPPPDRRLWKKQSMDRIAKYHQEDYERKNFTDPLGIAVQQTFGIGLSFMDGKQHISPPEKGEQPSTRRLQARAAKSALGYVIKLNTARDLQLAQFIEQEEAKDPKAVEAKKVELDKHVRDEISRLAQRLSELIPINHYHGSRTGIPKSPANRTIFVGSRKLKVVTGGEQLDQPALEELMRWYDTVILGKGPESVSESENGINVNVVPTTSADDSTPTKDPIVTDQEEDEYAYLKKRFDVGVVKGEKRDGDSNEDDPPDMGTLLV